MKCQMPHSFMRLIMVACMMIAIGLPLVMVEAEAAAAASASTSPSASASSAKPLNYYQRLGVSRDEARESSKLRKAYRKLALTHHPDKIPASASDSERASSQALFVSLARAYETLSDARLRARYDFLLSQGELEYDDSRDWNDFDVSQGFKRMKPKSKEEKEKEFKMKQAAEVFKRAQEEAEEFALWSSLSIAFLVALFPTIYVFIRRHANRREEESKRKNRSAELRQNQQLLMEVQEEQAKERQRIKEEERQYQKELREARAAAAATEEAETAASESNKPDSDEATSEWEVVDGNKRMAADDDDSNDAQIDDEEEDDRPKKRSGGGGSIIKCDVCNKKFKSQQQMDNHTASKQHQKAVKEAERAARKKSKKEE